MNDDGLVRIRRMCVYDGLMRPTSCLDSAGLALLLQYFIIPAWPLLPGPHSPEDTVPEISTWASVYIVCKDRMGNVPESARHIQTHTCTMHTHAHTNIPSHVHTHTHMQGRHTIADSHTHTHRLCMLVAIWWFINRRLWCSCCTENDPSQCVNMFCWYWFLSLCVSITQTCTPPHTQWLCVFLFHVSMCYMS